MDRDGDRADAEAAVRRTTTQALFDTGTGGCEPCRRSRSRPVGERDEQLAFRHRQRERHPALEPCHDCRDQTRVERDARDLGRAMDPGARDVMQPLPVSLVDVYNDARRELRRAVQPLC
jgi:hypothetical protein